LRYEKARRNGVQLNVGGAGAFAGGLAAGYFKTREEQRAQQRLAMMQQLVAREIESNRAVGKIVDKAKAEHDAREAAAQQARVGQQPGPSAVQPNGLAPGPAAVQPLPVGPQSGEADAGPSVGSSAHTARIIAQFGGPKYHELATAIDPSFVPEVAKNPDYEPGGSLAAPSQSLVGPAAGLSPDAYGSYGL
jgi:hypothetical protein